ncbi:MAG: DUF934 domain-containing protein [Myxococcota bacterium]
MPLFTPDGLQTDKWTHVSDEEEVPTSGPFTVSLTRWLQEADTLGARDVQKGVRLESSDEPERLAPFLPRLNLVVLHMPTFKDGRAFSQARLLRTRFRFRGQIRVTGHVVADQFKYLLRCGVDSVELGPNAVVESWKRTLEHQTLFYQGSARGAGLRARSSD